MTVEGARPVPQVSTGAAPWRRGAAPALLLVSLVAVAAWLLGGTNRYPLLDLQVYRDAVVAWQHGRPAYSLDYTSVGLPFTYPPFGLVALAWTGPLGFAASGVAITALSVAALAAVLVVVGRRAGWSGPATTAALAVGLWIEPVRSTLSFGQVNLVLLALVVLDALVVPDRFRGLLTGVATAVKLTPGIFLLFFLLTGDRRAAARQVGSAVALTLLTAAVAPRSSWHYWTSLVFDNRAGSPAYASNQALTGLVARAVGPSGATGALTAVLDVAVLALAVVAVRRCARAGERLTALGAAGVAGLLLSPISWGHHWVWALPLALALVSAGSAGRRVAGWALLTVFAVGPQDLMPSADDREYAWSWWQLVVGDLYPLLAVVCLTVTLLTLSGRRRRPGASRTARA